MGDSGRGVGSCGRVEGLCVFGVRRCVGYWEDDSSEHRRHCCRSRRKSFRCTQYHTTLAFTMACVGLLAVTGTRRTTSCAPYVRMI